MRRGLLAASAISVLIAFGSSGCTPGSDSTSSLEAKSNTSETTTSLNSWDDQGVTDVEKIDSLLDDTGTVCIAPTNLALSGNKVFVNRNADYYAKTPCGKARNIKLSVNEGRIELWIPRQTFIQRVISKGDPWGAKVSSPQATKVHWIDAESVNMIGATGPKGVCVSARDVIVERNGDMINGSASFSKPPCKSDKPVNVVLGDVTATSDEFDFVKLSYPEALKDNVGSRRTSWRAEAEALDDSYSVLTP